ncbi:MAG: lectin like domain-containing protein, partial [Propionibacteriaceae bacterium]|nr:lectin like domain-containing protein [Propionibacteriaceae bacterium]
TYGPIGFDLAARSKSPATKANYYDSNGNPDQADHMEIIVGWDDSYNSFTLAAAPPPGPGAWIVQNSWGTSFGDAGYHYVSYYDKTITAFDWYSFLSPTQHTINNSYAINANYSYPAKYSGKSLTAMLAANVYTAAQPMRLDAVQISNYTAGTNYTVSVYRGVSGVPNSGTITAATASRTNATFGLHYETLSQPVNLLAGEKYAIVVRYTLPTAGAYGPLMELETGTAQSYDGFTFSFDTPANMKLQAGQSYLAFDSTWWDLTTMGKGNGFTVGNNLLNGYANPVTVTGAWLDGAQATSAYQSDVSMLRQGSIAFAFSDGRTELLPLSNPNVAVTGYNTAKLGAQTVQVSAYGYTFTFPITMRKPPKLVDSLHTPSTPLYVKQGTYYQFSVGAFLGKTLTSQPISYKSSNTKVLAVSKTGLLSAYPVKKKTKVVLTVTSNVKTQKFTVYVVPKTLKVSGGKLTVQSKLKVGEYAFAKLTFTGTNPAVSYSSSNSKILKVNKYGLVIAKKKGKAKITAKVGSKKYTKTVKVV